MSKKSNGLNLVGLVALMSVMSAAPAFAQLGGVTGAVGGAVDNSVRTTATIRPTQTIRTDAPDVRAPARVRLDTRTSSSQRRYSNTRYSDTHYHGTYAHEHGRFGNDHFHDTGHSHTHGYASLVVEAKADKDRADVGPLLTYGVQVESKKGKDLGRINGLTLTESGRVTSITVDGVPKPIPVDTLKVEGDILVTSMKKKKLT